MYYIQLIGLLAFCTLVLSFYRKKTVTIIIYQATSNFAYAVHYFLLGALSGAFASVASIIRNIAFLCAKDKKGLIKLTFLLLILYFGISIVFYENISSILPAIANSTYMQFMLKNEKKDLLKGEIVCSIMWFIYGVCVNSYAEMVAEFLLFVSSIIQLKKVNKV